MIDPLNSPCTLRAIRYAPALSMRYYGLPIFLVGGALVDPDPRDIDIVISVPVDLFIAMYGDVGDAIEQWSWGRRNSKPTPLWSRWAKDCAKQGREMTMYCHRQVDFKTQPLPEFERFSGKQKLRIDNLYQLDKESISNVSNEGDPKQKSEE